MNAPLVIRETEPQGPSWDALVRRFPNRRVTHLSSWLGSLAAAQCGTPLALVFEKDGEPVGCLPGLVSRMGPWKIFGSPRAGWQTVSLGPVFDPARITTGEILAAAVPYLEREHQVAHIELMHTGLDPAAMRDAGFRGAPVFTYRAALHPDDPERTLRQFKDSARRNVTRARRLGVEVRFVERLDGFVDEHWNQLRDVFTRNGAAIPLSLERMRLTLENLSQSGNLLAVEAFLPGGRVCIATGTFLVEGPEIVLWQWAHRDHYRWYRATELMTWTVLERAMAMGCTTFDFMGGGDFKTRLGGEPDLSKMRWLRSRPRWLLTARSAAGSAFHVQQALRGRVRRGAAELRQRVAKMRTGARPAAVVIGDSDLVRALHLGGIATTLLAPPGSAAHYSRSVQRTLDWLDPAQAPESLVERLVAYGQEQSEPPVLFYEDDASLVFVSRHRDRLKQAFRFVVPDAGLVEDLAEKGRFQALARKLKLPVPPAVALDPARQGPGDAAGVTWPAAVKPLRKASRWMAISGGRKALRLESADEFAALWPQIAAAGLPVLVQSLIPGPESRIESYHVYVDERGGTAAEFTGRKIRTWPLEYGDSCALMISDAPDVAALGRDVVRRLKLRGLAKLDFKRAPDGSLVLLEVNARCTLWLHLAAAAGLNIPALVYADLLGLPRPEAPPARAGATWCKPWLDWKAARQSGVSLPRWLAWVSRCEAISAFAWDDPMPLVVAGFGRLVPRRLAANIPAAHAGLVGKSVASR